MSIILNRSVFHSHEVCPRLGWFSARRKMPPRDPSAMLIAGKEGADLRRHARGLFTDATVIGARGFEDAVTESARAVADSGVLSVIDAAFEWRGWRSRADILARADDGWRFTTVLPGMDKGQGRPPSHRAMDGISYAVMVMQGAGLPVSGVSVLRVDPAYRRGMDSACLFIERDITALVLERARECAAAEAEIAVSVARDSAPAGRLIWACRRCPIFLECTGAGISHHVFSLPRITDTEFARFQEENITSVDQIPSSVVLPEIQERARQAILQDRPLAGPSLKEGLNSISWPARYLDFETVATPMPLYDGVMPYEALVTQFALLVCSQPGVISAREDYMADPARDCRRDIAERLAAVLAGPGSVIVYGSYEGMIIRGLAARFPDLSDALHACADRLVDLCGLIEKSYYHPGFGGGFSLKNILPVLAPGFDYNDLAVRDGGTALSVYAQLARGAFPLPEDITRIRAELIEYCARDCMALARLHQALVVFGAG